MPTLFLDGLTRVDPNNDPVNGPGCHVVVKVQPNVSEGLVSFLTPDGFRRGLYPVRESYLPSLGQRQRTFVALTPGTYQAHSALTETTAVLVDFEVWDGGFVFTNWRFIGPDGALQKSRPAACL